jgi:hypothetical protein
MTFKFGECQVCGQGTLELYREPVGGALVIICDDCESQWLNPDDAKVGHAPLLEEFKTLVPASEEDVRAAGWDI